MRWVVGGQAVAKQAASASQIGRFETEWLASDENSTALVDLSSQWIDRVHGRRPLKAIVLDMDSSVSPTYGEQEGAALMAMILPEAGVHPGNASLTPCPIF
jgi:hypothetical protein